jgi:hypothetical protein
VKTTCPLLIFDSHGLAQIMREMHLHEHSQRCTTAHISQFFSLSLCAWEDTVIGQLNEITVVSFYHLFCQFPRVFSSQNRLLVSVGSLPPPPPLGLVLENAAGGREGEGEGEGSSKFLEFKKQIAIAIAGG